MGKAPAGVPTSGFRRDLAADADKRLDWAEADTTSDLPLRDRSITALDRAHGLLKRRDAALGFPDPAAGEGRGQKARLPRRPSRKKAGRRDR
jgi:hypothetical protein